MKKVYEVPTAEQLPLIGNDAILFISEEPIIEGPPVPFKISVR